MTERIFHIEDIVSPIIYRKPGVNQESCSSVRRKSFVAEKIRIQQLAKVC